MKIKLDKEHILYSEPYCYWICEITKENDNEYEKRVTGYETSFVKVVEDYIEKKIVSSNAEKITDLKNEFKKLQDTVNTWNFDEGAIAKLSVDTGQEDISDKKETSKGKSRNKRIKCIETGEIYSSYSSAAKAYGVSYSLFYTKVHKGGKFDDMTFIEI